MYNSVYFLRGVYVSHVTNLKSQFSMLIDIRVRGLETSHVSALLCIGTPRLGY